MQRPQRHREPWSPDEDNYLIWNCEICDIVDIASMLNRTISAARNRLHKLGIQHLGRGHRTLEEVSIILGYNSHTVLDLARRLKLILHRRRRTSEHEIDHSKRPYVISHEQLLIMTNEIKLLDGPFTINPQQKRGTWGGKRSAVCIICNSNSRQHTARNLCTRCYARIRRHGGLDKYPVTRPFHVHKTWGGRKPKCCLICHSNDRMHKGRRLCTRCYARIRKRGNLDEYPVIEK